MTINSEKLISLTCTLDGTDYSFQLTTAQVVNNTPDGDRVFTYAASGVNEFREVPDSAWSIALKWVSDWKTAGLNRFLAANDGTTQTLAINYSPGGGAGTYDRTWTGSVVLKQPSDGGDVRTTSMSEATWNFIGVPALTYGS